ncbi:hypothetical protein Golob_023240, partial [Gossypium lobatum]|nr:hypothetical protein [Gossypium lobatum]
MGNGSPSNLTDIGTNQIRMLNETIRILSDVKHVPDLKKSPISFIILDLKCCRINIKSSRFKVSCGALVLMKGKMVGSLYVLEGSTVTVKQ